METGREGGVNMNIHGGESGACVRIDRSGKVTLNGVSAVHPRFRAEWMNEHKQCSGTWLPIDWQLLLFVCYALHSAL